MSRPPLHSSVKRKMLSIRLTDDEKRELRSFGKGSPTRAVLNLIEIAKKYEIEYLKKEVRQ